MPRNTQPAREPSRGPATSADALPDWYTKAAIEGNSAQVLPTGRWTDHARQELIQTASRSIYISAFAWKDDAAGRGFLGLVTERARSGVDVRLLLDSFGSSPIKKYRRRIRESGARVLFFNPGANWDWGHWLKGLHEKLLIADGASLVIGGSGWSDQYRASSFRSASWYDLDLRVEGPAAAWFHDRFVATWRRSSERDREADLSTVMGSDGEDRDPFSPTNTRSGRRSSKRALEQLYGLSSFSPANPERRGKSRMLPVYGNPLLTDERPILDVYLKAIRAVRNRGSIKLYSPYCVPHKRLIAALLSARKRGVRVSILTNSSRSSDEGGYVTAAMYETTASLRRAGVKLYLWPKKSTMHRKGGVFDNRLAYLGSDNLDRRGQEGQSETVVFTDDRKVVRAVEADLDRDFAAAGSPVTEAFARKDLEAISPLVRSIARTIVDQL